jgi:hypothetical protein
MYQNINFTSNTDFSNLSIINTPNLNVENLYINNNSSINNKLFINNDLSCNGNLKTQNNIYVLNDISINNSFFVNKIMAIDEMNSTEKLQLLNQDNSASIVLGSSINNVNSALIKHKPIEGALPDVPGSVGHDCQIFLGHYGNSSNDVSGLTIKKGGCVGISNNNPSNNYSLDVTGNLNCINIFNNNINVGRVSGSGTINKIHVDVNNLQVNIFQNGQTSYVRHNEFSFTKSPNSHLVILHNMSYSVGGNYADTYLGKITVDYYDNDTSTYTLGHTSKEMYDAFFRATGGDARGGKLTNIMTSTSEDVIKNATNIKVYFEVRETLADDSINKNSNTWVIFEVFA